MGGVEGERYLPPHIMGNRHKSRELALQVLYEIEMKSTEPKLVFDLFWKHEEYPKEIKQFTVDIVEGVYRNRKEIDHIIEKHSTHWKLSRMAVVDRNILRVGVYELLYDHEIPTSVVINESIELGKSFGTEDSGAFINGILDHVAREVRQ